MSFQLSLDYEKLGLNLVNIHWEIFVEYVQFHREILLFFTSVIIDFYCFLESTYKDHKYI